MRRFAVAPILLPLVLSITFSLACPRQCFARGKRAWTFQQLFDESDAVVIAVATSVTVADRNTHIDLLDRNRKSLMELLKNDPSKLLEFFKDNQYLEGIITTFSVRLVLKGGDPGGKIEVVHCRCKHGTPLVINGPGLVCFRVEEGTEKALDRNSEFWLDYGPSHLLFLKERTDGRYEMMSGQMDPDDAVREMHRPRDHGYYSADGVTDIHFQPPRSSRVPTTNIVTIVVMAIGLMLTGGSWWRLRRKIRVGLVYNQIGP